MRDYQLLNQLFNSVYSIIMSLALIIKTDTKNGQLNKGWFVTIYKTLNWGGKSPIENIPEYWSLVNLGLEKKYNCYF